MFNSSYGTNDCPQIEVLEEITQKLADTSPNFDCVISQDNLNRHEKQKKKKSALLVIYRININSEEFRKLQKETLRKPIEK